MNLPANTALFTPSWHAELELGYGRFGDSTRPVLRRHLGPLRVQKHLYAEGPEVCQHIIVHPPGGIAGGDQLNISASAVNTPKYATLFFTMSLLICHCIEFTFFTSVYLNHYFIRQTDNALMIL